VRSALSALRAEVLERGALVNYLICLATTTTEGMLQVLYAPYLDAAGYALPVIGVLTSTLSVMRLVSRVPAGTGYRAERARRQIVLGLIALSATTAAFAFGGMPFLVIPVSLAHGFAFGSVGTVNLAATIDATGGKRAGAIMAWYTAALSTGYAAGSFLGGALADAYGLPVALFVAGLVPFLGILAAIALPRIEAAPHPVERGGGLGGLLRAGARIDQRVWLAFAIVLYVNLLADSVDGFFSLYGLAIGLPLAASGALRGLKSASATFIRFGSIVLFRFVDHTSINFWAVLVMGVAAFLIPFAGANVALLAVVFVASGLCRGILRVTSTATVAEMRAEGKDVGLASGIYNAGLDIGAIVGPAVGGVVASAVGIPAMYQIVAVGSLAMYFAVALSTAPGRASLQLRRRAVRSVPTR